MALREINSQTLFRFSSSHIFYRFVLSLVVPCFFFIIIYSDLAFLVTVLFFRPFYSVVLDAQRNVHQLFFLCRMCILMVKIPKKISHAVPALYFSWFISLKKRKFRKKLLTTREKSRLWPDATFCTYSCFAKKYIPKHQMYWPLSNTQIHNWFRRVMT